MTPIIKPFIFFLALHFAIGKPTCQSGKIPQAIEIFYKENVRYFSNCIKSYSLLRYIIQVTSKTIQLKILLMLVYILSMLHFSATKLPSEESLICERDVEKTKQTCNFIRDLNYVTIMV